MSPSIINLGIFGGWGRVYLDCWSLLYMVGEPNDSAQGIARPY